MIQKLCAIQIFVYCKNITIVFSISFMLDMCKDPCCVSSSPEANATSNNIITQDAFKEGKYLKDENVIHKNTFCLFFIVERLHNFCIKTEHFVVLRTPIEIKNKFESIFIFASQIE